MANPKSDRTSALAPILAVNFIGTLGYSIVLPFLVFLVTKWGGNAIIFGLVGAAYSFFQMLGAPLLGRWSDRFGRRRVLLLSQVGSLVSWVVLLFAFFLPERSLVAVDSELFGNFTITLPLLLLFLARATDGLTGGNVSVANAYLADITTDESRNEDFGKMAASANIGFIVGPFLAGILGATIWAELPPVLAAALISIVAVVLIWIRLPESNPCVITSSPTPKSLRRVFGQEQKNCYQITGSKDLSTLQLFRLPFVLPLFVIYFLVMLAFNFFYVVFPIFVVNKLNWDVTGTGIFFAVLSALMVIVQGPVLKKLARKIKESRLVVLGGIFLSVSFLFFMSHQLSHIYTGAALLALGNGLMWPSLLAVISEAAGSDRQGAVQGLAGSVGAVASIMGLLIGGLLYGFLQEWVFALTAACICVASLVAIFMKFPNRSTL